MKLYVVRSKDGKFLRPKGYGGVGNSWQEKLERAKFYPKLGTAKSRASFWFKNYPQFGCPEVLEFDLDVAKARICDFQTEIEKNIKKAKARAVEQQRRWDLWYNSQPPKP